MAKFTKKITNLINQQVPEFVLSDHPKFLEFVKTYYRFMESAEITLANIELTDGIQLETETAQTNSLILNASKIDTDRTSLDAGDKILLEDSGFGKFTRGETVTGQTSNATATVLSEDLVNNRLFISAQDKFIKDEVIIGSTSTARATISNYRPNPVNNIQDLLNFRDPDKAISNFLTKFRNEFLNTLPEVLDTNIDKRKLIKNIKSVYRAKGTQRGHEVFFRFLFNLDSETFYPREQMLRVSDGQFDTKKVLRAIATVGDTSNLIGRTITGQTSGATAVIENVFKFQIGANEVTEFIVNQESISGTFVTSEEIRGTETDETDTFIKATVTGIPDIVSITNDGGLLTPDDAITLTGGGTGAIIQVDNVGSGGITELLIDDAGSGYAIGDDLTFTNTNTNGGGVVAKVSVVNGGITPENGTTGATSTDHIVLEDETVRGDVYTGNKIVQEAGSGNEDITDIRIVSGGSGYTSLPTAVVSTGSGGSGAKVIPYGTEIGRLLNTKKIETGAGFEASPSPTMSLPSTIILKDKTAGNFTEGESITGFDASSTAISATFVSFSSANNLLVVKDATGEFLANTTITGASSEINATVLKNDLATATITVGAVVDTAGTFLNEDGHLSETTMKIQDSLYYQDFSYVIKVGRSITDWRDSFKKTMHTAGFYFTGQVDMATQVNNQIRSFTGVNSGLTFDPGADLVINTLFSTIFGRRLGTTTDGTSLRGTPELGVDPDFTDSTSEHFTTNTRDLTLNQVMTLKFRVGFNPITIRGTANKYGYAYCGPRMHTINKYALNMMSGSGGRAQTTTIGGASDSTVTTAISPMQMHNWASFRLTGTYNTSLDGELVQFQDITNRDLKTNLALPTEITES
tara:strand:+ start:1815 stop:4406 length:2592 start_codon:yes stop_codon:yes gene_type:complete